jgi:hypothetical protein
MFPTRRITTSGGDVFRDEFSLAFDGTDDYIATGADTSVANGTYMFWAKSSETGENRGIFGHGSTQIGAFHFHHASSKPLLYLNTDFYRFWDDTSAQDDGQWHFWVVVVNVSDITACRLYVDGIEQTASSTTSSGSAPTGDWTSGLKIGTNSAGSGNYCNCSISEFAWYNTILSNAVLLSHIKTIYNGREPYNHKEGVMSNYLQGWWRMGDGLENHSGTTIYDMSDNTNNGTMTNMSADDFEGDTP